MSFPAEQNEVEHEFLWKGKDPRGEIHSVRVSACNAQTAKERLAQEGWSELHLMADE